LGVAQQHSSDGGGVVAVSVSGSACVLRGPALALGQALEFLAAADRPAQRVEIEAVLFEVQGSDDWRVGLSAQVGNNQSPTNGVAARGAAVSDVTTLANSVVGGYAAVVTRSAHVVLQAVQSLTSVRVLSQPTVGVDVGQEAVLQVGDQVPTVTQETAATVNAGSSSQVVYRNVGVILRVQPELVDGGLVRIRLAQEVSQASETTTSAIDSPTISTRSVQTVVTLPVGQTALIGGMCAATRTVARTGLPGLASLPVIGALMGVDDDGGQADELVLLLTPRVVDERAELARIRAVVERIGGPRSMISCLFGKPGSGKSFEAVAYHLLPALQRGRLVITNLPVNLDQLAEDLPDAIDLVQRVEGVFVFEGEGERRKQVSRKRPFADIGDYASEWKHPELGVGPLYIIDECHFCYPLAGASEEEKRFLRDVSEWYSMHRHRNIDVVLVTQHYGKVYKHVRDMVEVWIGLRNNRNLGLSWSYRRFAGDDPRGIHKEGRGEVRKYNKRIFSYYQSYTLGGKGKELGPQDVKPIWRHPVFWLLGFGVAVIAGLIATGHFHPLAPLYGGSSAASSLRPAAVVPAVVQPLKVEMPKVEAVVVGRIGALVLIKVGDKTRSLDAWRSEGVTVLGEPGRCPWGMVLKAGPASGRCS
jgi:zona occludens toxin